MAFEKFNPIMICDGEIRNIQAAGIVVGYEFEMQYPSYRGTFLSCIEKFEISLDGEPVASENIGFYLNGKEFLVEELPELFREYWFTMDHAVIRVYGDGLEPGSEHKISTYMRHRIPYTGYFGNYMIEDSTYDKVLKVAPNVEVPVSETAAAEQAADDSELKLSLSLYSLTPLYVTGELDFEGTLKAAHDMGYTGIEIVAAQMVPGYPNPDKKWLEALPGLLAKYDLHLVCWSAYIDMGIRSDRDLSEAEIIQYTRNDLIYAKIAGADMVRTQHAITPEIYKSMLPLCKKLDMKLVIEMHSPHHPRVPEWQEYLKIMKDPETEGYFGVVPDFSIFQHSPHLPHLNMYRDMGVREEALQQMVADHDAGKSLEEIKAGRDDYTELELHAIEEIEHLFCAPAKIDELEGLLECAPYIHGKFHYLPEECVDRTIPYEELIPIVKKSGFNGYLTCEYEGHEFNGTTQEQLRRFVSMIRRIERNME